MILRTDHAIHLHHAAYCQDASSLLAKIRSDEIKDVTVSDVKDALGKLKKALNGKPIAQMAFDRASSSDSDSDFDAQDRLLRASCVPCRTSVVQVFLKIAPVLQGPCFELPGVGVAIRTSSNSIKHRYSKTKTPPLQCLLSERHLGLAGMCLPPMGRQPGKLVWGAARPSLL
jgi:hypothetical protein